MEQEFKEHNQAHSSLLPHDDVGMSSAAAASSHPAASYDRRHDDGSDMEDEMKENSIEILHATISQQQRMSAIFNIKQEEEAEDIVATSSSQNIGTIDLTLSPSPTPHQQTPQPHRRLTTASTSSSVIEDSPRKSTLLARSPPAVAPRRTSGRVRRPVKLADEDETEDEESPLAAAAAASTATPATATKRKRKEKMTNLLAIAPKYIRRSFAPPVTACADDESCHAGSPPAVDSDDDQEHDGDSDFSFRSGIEHLPGRSTSPRLIRRCYWSESKFRRTTGWPRFYPRKWDRIHNDTYCWTCHDDRDENGCLTEESKQTENMVKCAGICARSYHWRCIRAHAFPLNAGQRNDTQAWFCVDCAAARFPLCDPKPSLDPELNKGPLGCNSKDPLSRSVLMCALEDWNWRAPHEGEYLRYLFTHFTGAELKINHAESTKERYTTLMYGVVLNIPPSYILQLLQAGADINQPSNEYGSTALHLAMFKKEITSTLALLTSPNLNVKATLSGGRTLAFDSKQRKETRFVHRSELFSGFCIIFAYQEHCRAPKKAIAKGVKQESSAASSSAAGSVDHVYETLHSKLAEIHLAMLQFLLCYIHDRENLNLHNGEEDEAFNISEMTTSKFKYAGFHYPSSKFAAANNPADADLLALENRSRQHDGMMRLPSRPYVKHPNQKLTQTKLAELLLLHAKRYTRVTIGRGDQGDPFVRVSRARREYEILRRAFAKSPEYSSIEQESNLKPGHPPAVANVKCVPQYERLMAKVHADQDVVKRQQSQPRLQRRSAAQRTTIHRVHAAVVITSSQLSAAVAVASTPIRPTPQRPIPSAATAAPIAASKSKSPTKAPASAVPTSRKRTRSSSAVSTKPSAAEIAAKAARDATEARDQRSLKRRRFPSQASNAAVEERKEVNEDEKEDNDEVHSQPDVDMTRETSPRKPIATRATPPVCHVPIPTRPNASVIPVASQQRSSPTVATPVPKTNVPTLAQKVANVAAPPKVRSKSPLPSYGYFENAADDPAATATLPAPSTSPQSITRPRTTITTATRVASTAPSNAAPVESFPTLREFMLSLRIISDTATNIEQHLNSAASTLNSLSGIQAKVSNTLRMARAELASIRDLTSRLPQLTNSQLGQIAPLCPAAIRSEYVLHECKFYKDKLAERVGILERIHDQSIGTSTSVASTSVTPSPPPSAHQPPLLTPATQDALDEAAAAIAAAAAPAPPSSSRSVSASGWGSSSVSLADIPSSNSTFVPMQQ